MNGENKSHTPKTECDRSKIDESVIRKEYDMVRELNLKIYKNFIDR